MANEAYYNNKYIQGTLFIAKRKSQAQSRSNNQLLWNKMSIRKFGHVLFKIKTFSDIEPPKSISGPSKSEWPGWKQSWVDNVLVLPVCVEL